jgi:hypothetical protein
MRFYILYLFPYLSHSYFLSSYHYNSIPLNIVKNNKPQKEMVHLNFLDTLEIVDKWYDIHKYKSYDNEESYSNFINSHSYNPNMNTITNIKYNLEFDKEFNSRFLLWKPKIKKQIHDNSEYNNLFGPIFRDSLCLVDYIVKDDRNVSVKNIITSPFYCDTHSVIKNTCKERLKEYFIYFLKYDKLYEI